LCQRRFRCLKQIEELSPRVRQASGLEDAIANIELCEAGIAIGLKNAGEPGEVRPRVLALAIGGVRPSPGASTGTVVSSAWRRAPLSTCRASASSRGRSSAAV
jgi:hypothetical protein